MTSYEFQAIDKFFRFIRGKVITETAEKAKELVKSRGYWLPRIWETGTRPWMSRGRPKAGGEYHTPILKLKCQNSDMIIYQAKKWLHIMFSFLFVLMGLALISYPFFYESFHNNTATMFFILIVGAVFLAVGCFLFLLRFELCVNRSSRQVILRMRVIPFNWKYQIIDTSSAERIVVRKDVLYATAGEVYYIVLLVIGTEEYQLDASSSKKAELNLGQQISDFLNIPFVYEEIDNSPSARDIERALSLCSLYPFYKYCIYPVYKYIKAFIRKIFRMNE